MVYFLTYYYNATGCIPPPSTYKPPRHVREIVLLFTSRIKPAVFCFTELAFVLMLCSANISTVIGLLDRGKWHIFASHLQEMESNYIRLITANKNNKQYIHDEYQVKKGNKKSIAIPIISRRSLQGWEMSRIPHFLDIRLIDGGCQPCEPAALYSQKHTLLLIPVGCTR
jgi:hypothetical protein